jgi:hypothetical protein
VNPLYHIRAYRYSKQLWGSHLQGVAQFLSGLKPTSRLILIGPSGGYSLPQSFLEQFEVIQVIEPDPLARLILLLRFWFIRERFEFYLKKLDFESLDFLDGFEPETASILFCNVLGQVPVKSEAAFQRTLRARLQNLKWASFHDRFSAADVAWRTPDGPQIEIQKTDNSLITQPKMKALQEHLASDALSALPIKRIYYWDWQVAPDQVHLIEGLASD